MEKIDMPLLYIDEAIKLNEILFDSTRTVTGNISWTSSSSGVVYNTANSTEPNILNCGELGLANLLKATYGGDGGWLLMATDFNSKSESNHTHGNITNDGKVGSTANKALYTTTNGNVISGIMPIAAGGTGKATMTSGALLKGDGISPITELSGVGALYSSTQNSPTFGVLPVAHGGTGQTTYALLRNALGLGNTIGTLPIANGGTGATTLSSLREALGLGSNTNALSVNYGGTGVTSLQALRNALGLGNTTNALPIANGGTGATTAAEARNALGLGNTTGALSIANGGTGAATKANAKTNLGISYGTSDPTGGENGDIYFKIIS